MKQNSLRALFLCMLMLVLVVSLPATAAGGAEAVAETVILEAKPIKRSMMQTDDGFACQCWSDGTGSISSYYRKLEEVTVPWIVEGYPIRRVESDAFDQLQNLTKVILPEGIKIIEQNAFINCPSLVSISLPDSLTFIDDNAFVNNGSLTLLVSEGSYAHEYAKQRQFAWEIEQRSEEKSPVQVLETENQVAFRDGAYAYMLLEDGTAEIASYLGNETILTLPDTLGGLPVTRIGEYAFLNQTGLKAVAIPEGVKSIGSYAFHSNSNLRVVTFPHSLLNIEICAFERSGLIKLILPDGIQTISGYAFYSCDSLTEAVLPDSLLRIDFCAFSFCPSLKSVNIPASVETIDDPFILSDEVVLTVVRGSAGEELAVSKGYKHIISGE